MRLLTEDMPVPAINIRALASRLPKETSVAQIDSSRQPEVEPVENRNLTLARQVEQYKSELIQCLSNFPVTAMWLLDKYDTTCTSIDGDEDSSPPSGLDEYLQPLRINFQSLQSFSAKPVNIELALRQAKLNLKQSIIDFPLAFEDLKSLVDLMINLVVLEDDELCLIDNLDAKSRDIVRRRLSSLDGVKARDSILKKVGKHPIISHMNDKLLPDMNESVKSLSQIILAEHYWLFYRQQLAMANTKLVLFIANQYKGSFLDFDDLVQEGQSGLLKAVDRFKYQLGFQFSTYAGYWIRQAISRALSRCERVVRIPCGQVATINRIFKTKEELLQKTGREPSIKEIAERINLSEEEVYNIILISQGAVSLEAFDEDEDENSFAPIDFVEQSVFSHSSETIAENQLHSLVDAAIKTLNPREAKIIKSHFGMNSEENKTLQQIGAELNLTRERVRQIQVVALNKIKMRYGEQLLSFL